MRTTVILLGMNQSIVLLGRQPALGLAELESLFGADAVQPIGREAALLAVDPAQLPFERLGGSIKAAKLLTRLETTDWKKVVKHICTTLPDHLGYIPEGKIRLGLNVVGLKAGMGEINRSGLEIKKVIKSAGRSVRVVPNTDQQLSSAQSLHNQTTGSTGLEFLIVRDGNTTLLAQVTHVQDINAYAARDQKRPKRDARVGMLPPKLAQIIINLANPSEGETLLDPFCGTGVILQEASLMGFDVYGTDLEPRMIEYSQENLRWLTDSRLFTPPPSGHRTETADATSYEWRHEFSVVACETYLGRPFSAEPDSATLQQVMSDVNVIHKKFLQNLANQTQPGFRACLAVPAWFTRSGIKHLKILDSLEELGYNRVSFVHAEAKDLIYHRKGQIVGRELVVITRK